jgi:hypothetical protein
MVETLKLLLLLSPFFSTGSAWTLPRKHRHWDYRFSLTGQAFGDAFRTFVKSNDQRE